MTYNYTNTFKNAIELSFQKAKDIKAIEVTPDLLLYGILKEGNNPSLEYLNKYGLDTNKLLEEYEFYLEAHTARSSEDIVPTLGNTSRQAIAEAVKLCSEEEPAITPMFLFRTLLEGDYNTFLKKAIVDKSILSPITSQQRQSISSFAEAITKLLGLGKTKKTNPRATSHEEEELEESDDERQDIKASEASGTTSTTRKKQQKGKTPLLSQFSRDITALAQEGILDPVVGRTDEIERIAQILGRRRKSNPILIGEPGVGKTSLVEGLAQRIVANDVPAHLIGKRILELDLSGLVAGTKYRGQFEERIKGIIDELEASHNIIIYIDEIHTMVGAGGGNTTMDAANMLKPSLARGGMQCIGATTLEEYRKHIEKDGALERRFQKVIVSPSTPEETLEILHQIRKHYEDHHKVTFTDESLKTIVTLAERYLNDRYFPDKAIDLMDETGSRKGSKKILPDTINPVLELERQRSLFVEKKIEAIREQKFELATSYRNKERELEQQIQEAQEKLTSQNDINNVEITSDDVAEVIAIMTSIPTQSINNGELEQLKELESNLRSKVIGQDEAVRKVSQCIKRNRLGLREEKRPIGSFMLLGPTGVGKTHLVKSLCLELFGSLDALIRVDMSEFMEKFAVSRLVGAPPGYIGHDEGGQLTEQVRRRPYSIVLFDEIEKAHPDVFNLLLQVLDEGFLTDSYGRKVDFRNTVIMITSNVGSRQAKDFGRSIGYFDEQLNENRSSDIIRKALNKTFSPEFLNRLDEVITFNPLSKKDLERIILVELKPLQKRLSNLGYTLELDEQAINTLIKQAYTPDFGARPLRRVLQREIEDRLTDLILEGKITEGGVLRLTAKNNQIIHTP